MFKQLHFNISLADALILMPKYTKMLKDLCANKEKLEELANTPLSENCSAVILKKLPEKLGDSCRFTIPCDFSKLKCQGLADLRASNQLNASLDFHRKLLITLPDEQIPLILGRPFLRTHGALIMFYDEKLILRDGNESLTLNMQSEKSKLNGIQRVESINMIDIFNVPNYIGFKDLFAQMYSGSPTIQSDDSFPSPSPMKTSDSTFDKFTLPNSLPPGDDVSILKKDFQEDTFRIISNPLFEFNDNFKSSDVNPLFEENDKDVKIKSSSSFTLTSPEESELEAYLDRDSIPPGIDLTLPPTFEVSSSNPTSPTLTGEKDLKKDLPISFDSTTESSILPPPLLDSDSPFTAELSASENLKENISSGTLLVFKEPSFLLPPPEPPDDFLKNVVLNFYQSNVEDVNSFTFIIWIFLPHFTYSEDSPLIFSFQSENFVFDPGTDKSEITRKQSKASKHGHENQKSSKRSQSIKAEARKVKPQSNPVKEKPIIEIPSSNDSADENIAKFEVASKSKSSTSKPEKVTTHKVVTQKVQTKPFLAESRVPIRNCILGLAPAHTWACIGNKTFETRKPKDAIVADQDRSRKKKV
ncbi:hypothetical protein Tco_0410484 [Tanacetum coccineum]